MSDVLKLVAIMLVLAAAAVWCAARDVFCVREGKLDVGAFLAAVRAVESGDQPFLIGALGERSAYQFTRSTWGRMTREPYSVASFNTSVADRVAVLYLTEIRCILSERELFESPSLLAAMWRHGPYCNEQLLLEDHAQRVATLYHENVMAKTRKVSQ